MSTFQAVVHGFTIGLGCWGPSNPLAVSTRHLGRGSSSLAVTRNNGSCCLIMAHISSVLELDPIILQRVRSEHTAVYPAGESCRNSRTAADGVVHTSELASRTRAVRLYCHGGYCCPPSRSMLRTEQAESLTISLTQILTCEKTLMLTTTWIMKPELGAQVAAVGRKPKSHAGASLSVFPIFSFNKEPPNTKGKRALPGYLALSRVGL